MNTRHTSRSTGGRCLSLSEFEFPSPNYIPIEHDRIRRAQVGNLGKKIQTFALDLKRVYGAHVVIMTSFRDEDKNTGAIM